MNLSNLKATSVTQLPSRVVSPSCDLVKIPVRSARLNLQQPGRKTGGCMLVLGCSNKQVKSALNTG